MKITFIAIGLIIFLACFAHAEKFSAESQERSFTMQTHPELELKNDDGRTVVRAHDGSDIVVRYTKEVNHVRDLDQAKKEAQKVQIRIDQTGNRLNVEVQRPHGWDVHFFGPGPSVLINFEILVPAETDVKIKAVDGPVQMEGIDGRLNVKVTDGDTTIRSCKGEMNLSGTDGDVVLEKCSGTLTLDLVDGNVSADECTGSIQVKAGDGKVVMKALQGNVAAETGDGSLSLEGTFDTLRAKVSDGDMKVTVENGSTMKSDWSLRSSDGNIDLRLPQDFSADFDISTSDGKIHTTVPVSIEGSINQDRLEGKMNGGGQRFEVHTSDGNIDIGSVTHQKSKIRASFIF